MGKSESYHEESERITDAVVSMLKEEVQAATKTIKEEVLSVINEKIDTHTRDDASKFATIDSRLDKIADNHSETIRLLQESKDVRLVMMGKLDGLVTKMETHEGIINKGKGMAIALGIFGTLGGAYTFLKNFFH